ncbi:MAG: TRAP transporter fused permease subunit [Pseudomonadota bacterium]
MDNVIRKVVTVLAIFGTMYHLYLVLHPYTPLANLKLSILDLTQVQRATHVLLVALIGYLWSHVRKKKRSISGSLPLVLMTLPLLIEVFRLDLPLALKLVAALIWICTMLPGLLPALLRPSSLVCALLAFLPYIYLVVNYDELIYRAIMPEPWDVIMGYSQILLILGVIFRLSGPIMPTIVMVFLLYNLYGNSLPGFISGPGFDLEMLIGKMFCETEAGIFGSITGVSVKYLVYFTILGAVVTRLKFGQVIANIALLFVGRSPASPGRCSSVMAVLMGMFSGSGAADTQFVGALTRPLFEKVGYDKMVAAGVIATVGSVAYVTPPVMGSVSFLMVELLSIPYASICIMAIGPMLLYLFGVVTFNELYVKKMRLPQLDISTNIDFSYFKRYCYVFIPIIFIIILIYKGFSINLTVSAATLLFVIFAYADPSIRPPLKNLGKGLEEGFLGLLPIASAVIAANMIMAMMVMSGLASKFSMILMNISGSSLLLAVLFTGVFSLILGMGVPPIATYVLTSALTAPTIQNLAMQSGMPEGAALLATHMFLFYFAVLAEVTPPVALSAYAAASVIGTDPVKTAIAASRVALPSFFIGLTFILSTSGSALLIVPVLETMHGLEAFLFIIPRFFFVILAVFSVSVGMVGFFRKNLIMVERLIIGVAGILLFYPHTTINIVTGIVVIGFFVKKWLEVQRDETEKNVLAAEVSVE